MFAAALRRFAVVTLGVAGVTGAVALLVGAALGADADRSVSLGYYLVGSFTLLAGVFVGSRGPIRVKSETIGSTLLPLPFFGDRRLRWATRDEQEDALNNSAVFVAVGFMMLVFGLLIDSRYKLF
jgi:hypothetical protein